MISITPSAQNKIQEFLAVNADKVFRISVSSGGCSGFSYTTKLDDPGNDDVEISCKVVTDPISATMLGRATLDYVDSLGFSGFTFQNPDAKNSCGCGMSFDY